MWFFTVFSAIPRCSPISRFDIPSPMRSRTRLSDGVSDAVGSLDSAWRRVTVAASSITRPSETAAIISLISLPRIVFRMYARAPASSASDTAASSSNVVRTIGFASGLNCLNPFITSIPVPSGSCRSTSSTSGLTIAPRRSASSTDPASATT